MTLRVRRAPRPITSRLCDARVVVMPIRESDNLTMKPDPISRHRRTRAPAQRDGSGRAPAERVDVRPRTVRGILWGATLALPLWLGVAAALRLIAGLWR
jgi:hypothetical protein